MSGTALLIAGVVRDGDVHVTDAHYKARRQKSASKWGDGTVLTIRIEPEDEAYTHAQLKHYYGHIVTPLSEWNGETVTEWDLRLKGLFLPEGKTSKTQCNRDELAKFIESCEVYAHTNHPEAFALYDNVRGRG